MEQKTTGYGLRLIAAIMLWQRIRRGDVHV